MSKKKTKHTRLRKILTFLSIAIIIVACAQYVFYFYALPLLKTKICNNIIKKTNGLYSVDFDSLKINFIARTFEMKNFRLQPDTSVYIQLKKAKIYDNAIYNIEINNLIVKNIKLKTLLGYPSLEINKILLQQPIVRLAGKPNESQENHEKYDAIHKDLYPLISKYFNELKINQIDIVNGYFDFYLNVTDNTEKAIVGNINITLNNMLVNEKEYKSNDKLFYSKKILMDSHGYQIRLADSIHTITANQLHINSEDSTILATNVSLLANQQTNNKKDLFNVKLDSIAIIGLDLNKAYFQKNVTIKNVKIINSNINFSKANNIIKNKKTIKVVKSDWYSLIKGSLKSISIDTLSIDSAKISISNTSKFTKPAYEIGTLNLKLNGFLLDSTAYRNSKKILYSNNLSINLKKFKMRMPDRQHLLTAKQIKLSTLDKNLIAKSLNIHPLKETKDSTIKQINISIPSFSIENINLIKAFNQKNYEIGKLSAYTPHIQIKSFIDSIQNSNNNSLLATLFNEYFKSLKIKTFNIQKAVLDITSKTTIVEDSLTIAGKINISFNNFLLNENTINKIGIPFVAKNLNLNLTDLTIKPSKNIHALTAQKIIINSIDSIIDLQNIKYTATSDSNLIYTMKRLYKNSITDFKINHVSIEGIDLNKAVEGQNIALKRIKISKPTFFQNYYPQLKFINQDTTPLTNNLDNDKQTHRDSIFNLLNTTDKALYKIIPSNIVSIRIDSLTSDSGAIQFSIRDTLNNQLTSTQNNFALNIQKFNFNRDSLPDSTNFLFAKDYNLDINGLELLLPDKTHRLKSANLIFSTQKGYLWARQLWLGKSKDTIQTGKLYYNAYLPELKIVGIKLPYFAQTGKLNIDTLNTDNIVFLTIIPQPNKSIDSTEISKKTLLPKSLKINHINSFGVKFAVLNDQNNTQNRIVNADFDFSCDNFAIDSTNYNKYGYPYSLENPYINTQKVYFQSKNHLSTFNTNYLKLKNDTLEIRHLFIKKQENITNDTTQGRLQIYFPKIKIANTNLQELIFGKKIIANDIHISKAEAELYLPPIQQKKSKEEQTKEKTINTIIANLILADSINLTINQPNKKQIKLNNIDVRIEKINTDSITDNMFPAKKIVAGINNYSAYLKDSLYKLHTGRIEFSPIDNSLKVKNFNFCPTTLRYDFNKKFTYRKNAPFISCNTIVAQGINVSSILNNKLIISKLYLDRLSFFSYIDKTFSYDTAAIKPTLQQYIRKIPFKTKIDSTYINNSYIAIEQIAPETNIPGILTLNNITAQITNINNIDNEIKKDSILKIDAYGMLMNKSKISASFRYKLNSPTDEFYCNAQAESIFLPDLNPYLENAVFAKIEDGKLHSASIKFTSDNIESKGEMILKYNDLKLSVNKKDSTQTKRRGLLSFLANSIIRTDNPKHRFSRTKTGYIYTHPDSYKGFASYWIKSLLSGIKATAGFESKEQKDERKLSDKIKDIISTQRRKENKRKQKQKEIFEKEIEENRKLHEKKNYKQSEIINQQTK